jgi:hypothetical protein
VRAHLADRDGGPPAARESLCGWRQRIIGTGQNERAEWQPQGSRIGRIENDALYLDPSASYRAAQRLAVDRSGVKVSSATLVRRLREKGLLASTNKARETVKVRSARKADYAIYRRQTRHSRHSGVNKRKLELT